MKQARKSNAGRRRFGLIGWLSFIVVIFVLYLGFCALKASSIFANQHDAAIPRFLATVHPLLSGYRASHGVWPTKVQLKDIGAIDCDDGAGGRLTRKQAEELWAECVLLQPVGRDEPLAIIGCRRTYSDRPVQYVLLPTGEVRCGAK